MEEIYDSLSPEQLKPVLECMLFVSPQPLMMEHVAKSLGIEVLVAEQAIHELRLDFGARGLQIVRLANGYQMCTRPEFAHFISLLHKPQRTRLSRAALETLAIIAYRQPITPPEVEAIRGVNSDGVMKTLMDKGFVRQVGKKETPGRPTLYATTEEFLAHFGMNDLTDLPELWDGMLQTPATTDQPKSDETPTPEPEPADGTSEDEESR